MTNNLEEAQVIKFNNPDEAYAAVQKGELVKMLLTLLLEKMGFALNQEIDFLKELKSINEAHNEGTKYIKELVKNQYSKGNQDIIKVEEQHQNGNMVSVSDY